MVVAKQTPIVLDIERARADTFPFTLVFTDKATKLPIDFTGSTFKLTVDPSPKPLDAVNNLFTNVPVIVAPATDGRIQITLSTADADQTPSTYFHDIEETDSGGFIRSLAKGKWLVEQGITK